MRSELLKFYQNYLTDSQLFRNTRVLSELFNKFDKYYLLNSFQIYLISSHRGSHICVSV